MFSIYLFGFFYCTRTETVTAVECAHSVTSIRSQAGVTSSHRIESQSSIASMSQTNIDINDLPCYLSNFWLGSWFQFTIDDGFALCNSALGSRRRLLKLPLFLCTLLLFTLVSLVSVLYLSFLCLLFRTGSINILVILHAGSQLHASMHHPFSLIINHQTLSFLSLSFLKIPLSTNDVICRKIPLEHYSQASLYIFDLFGRRILLCIFIYNFFH